MKVIDLRSDTVTLPTREMLEYMITVPVGDDGRAKDSKGEDPTAAEAEAYAAEVFGREDALYVTSGTMGNMVCLATHCKRGNKVVTAKNMHMYKNEKGLFSPDLCGLVPVLLDHKRGVYDLKQLEETLATGEIKVVCLENSYNFEGGCCISRADIEKILEICKRYGVRTHMDGARVFNAAAALNTTVAELTAGIDSVQFCVSKGLSAPIGSFLVGSAEFIAAARNTRKLLGGQCRQVGLLAGAGMFAIKNLSARLSEDNARARRLAEGIKDARNLCVDLEACQTNIIKLELRGELKGKAWLKALEEEAGIRAHYVSDDTIRLVTYRGITDEDIEQAISRINTFCANHE